MSIPLLQLMIYLKRLHPTSSVVPVVVHQHHASLASMRKSRCWEEWRTLYLTTREWKDWSRTLIIVYDEPENSEGLIRNDEDYGNRDQPAHFLWCIPWFLSFVYIQPCKDPRHMAFPIFDSPTLIFCFFFFFFWFSIFWFPILDFPPPAFCRHQVWGLVTSHLMGNLKLQHH